MRVQYAGPVFDEKEIQAATACLAKGWLGLAESGLRLESQLAKRLGQDKGVLTNSGSSANLLAISALKSKRFKGPLEKPLEPGDEIITPACGFPTTVNPILQNGFVPVFVDIKLGTYNLDVNALEAALSPRTRAIAFAHTLGNIPDMDVLMEFCHQHRLVLIEDCCDALGGTWDNRPVGSFGDFSTLSFYPSHHMTMGEGGFVASGKENYRILQSLRDWGRDCYCSGQACLLKDGSCGERFKDWLGVGYDVDHKYVYSEIGYNVKPIELQAAIGLEQIKKLDSFIQARRNNFARYQHFFEKYREEFILPQWLPKANPSWFAYPLTLRGGRKFKKADLTSFLERNGIQTRNLFAGNLLRHPAYQGVPHRVVHSLDNSDEVLRSTFFIGVYPGITGGQIDHVCATVTQFMEGQR